MAWKAVLLAGFMLPYGTQPGGTAAAEFTLHQPDDPIAFVGTFRGGAFTRPDHFTRGLVGADAGFTLHPDKPARVTLAGGAAWLPTARVDRVSVDLATGATTTHVEPEHLGLLNASVTFAHDPHDVLGWYANLTFGSTLNAAPDSNTLFFSVGLGLRFTLGSS